MLFVCVHNAGRSQMAAGLVKLRSDGRIHVRSAGSDPGETINPAVIEAMDELGVDMGDEFPKPLTDEVVRAADVVITMGCGDACPIYPGKKYEDWVLDDPEGQSLETVRRIRDELDAQGAPTGRRADARERRAVELTPRIAWPQLGTAARCSPSCTVRPHGQSTTLGSCSSNREPRRSTVTASASPASASRSCAGPRAATRTTATSQTSSASWKPPRT